MSNTNELRTLLKTTPDTEHTTQVIIHTQDDQYTVPIIEALDYSHDYRLNNSVYTHLSVLIPPSEWVKNFYPKSNNLEITLTIDFNENKSVRTYKAIVLEESKINPDAADTDLLDNTTLDTVGFIRVHFQLIALNVEILRAYNVSGSYKNQTVDAVITSLLNDAGNKVKVRSKKVLEKITSRPSDNKRQYKHITIPPTKILGLTKLLQSENKPGIYNAGEGFYIDMIEGLYQAFIYPLYNFNNPIQYSQHLTVIIDPKTKASLFEKTYYIEEGEIKIMVSTDAVSRNDKEAGFVNNGSGFRMPHRDSIMGKPVIMDESGPIPSRERLNYEAVITERSDGVNYPITMEHMNPFLAASTIAENNGHMLEITWSVSDPYILKPGMGVSIQTYQEEELKIIKGILLGQHTFINHTKIPTTKLFIFIERS